MFFNKPQNNVPSEEVLAQRVANLRISAEFDEKLFDALDEVDNETLLHHVVAEEKGKAKKKTALESLFNTIAQTIRGTNNQKKSAAKVVKTLPQYVSPNQARLVSDLKSRDNLNAQSNEAKSSSSVNTQKTLGAIAGLVNDEPKILKAAIEGKGTNQEVALNAALIASRTNIANTVTLAATIAAANSAKLDAIKNGAELIKNTEPSAIAARAEAAKQAAITAVASKAAEQAQGVTPANAGTKLQAEQKAQVATKAEPKLDPVAQRIAQAQQAQQPTQRADVKPQDQRIDPKLQQAEKRQSERVERTDLAQKQNPNAARESAAAREAIAARDAALAQQRAAAEAGRVPQQGQPAVKPGDTPKVAEGTPKLGGTDRPVDGKKLGETPKDQPIEDQARGFGPKNAKNPVKGDEGSIVTEEQGRGFGPKNAKNPVKGDEGSIASVEGQDPNMPTGDKMRTAAASWQKSLRGSGLAEKSDVESVPTVRGVVENGGPALNG